MASTRGSSPGVSLIELLVAVSIMLAIAAIVLPLYLGQRERALDSSAKANVGSISSLVGTAMETPDGGDLVANPVGSITGAEGQYFDGGVAGRVAIPANYYLTWNTPERAWCVEGTEGPTWFFSDQVSGGIREGRCPF